MPTAIKRAYLAQGYRLPEGLTWSDVAEERARWGVPAFLVPVARVPGGAVGWAVPHVDGRPLRRP